ncbi:MULTISPECIES: hypothetical protein [Actinomycetes]|uniref:Secreted protein n=2 Tax=Streptomyces rimosus subsp. rimosus TaxID=132474 RepID=A0A8A1UYN6_STRR1|nr:MULTISPECIES: hypothetical protein [Streptomyces]KOG83828.1 hypothetical protein ADK78_02115 [Kitasatospora aureofaciens]MYT46273.1 hypothetical protein [Streptomyces sp. SID5471]KEF07184.1 hypothetical protein DF17_09785 [Streptomyces rimosus]KEF19518.1 hypothetical protein DF18_15665 [Streptomyces rimosus]KOT26897.1 hypothetical protein ADK84_39615 [Streptomyces sp. NRRL WC-3701]
MSTGRPSKARRVAAAAIAAGLALVVSGCGGDDGGGAADGKPPTRAAAPKTTGRGTPAADTTQAIGEMKGPDGVVVTLHSAVRDSGGFVTVSGTVTNKGTKIFNAINWRSNETGMRSRSSVSGATLVDKAGKKRYLVLRDTEGECLCTTGLSGLKPGESRPLFAQFPAPPEKVTEVDFQLPTLPPATVTISD